MHLALSGSGGAWVCFSKQRAHRFVLVYLRDSRWAPSFRAESFKLLDRTIAFALYGFMYFGTEYFD